MEIVENECERKIAFTSKSGNSLQITAFFCNFARSEKLPSRCKGNNYFGMRDSDLRKKRNFLLRVRQVNDIYLEHSRRGVFTENIYRLYIRDRFFISRSTFYFYLSVPYKKLLNETGRQD
jgi:hypothetical protein